MFLISPCSCLWAIYWSQVLSRDKNVVRAAPTGDGPTTSERSTILLPYIRGLRVCAFPPVMKYLPKYLAMGALGCTYGSYWCSRQVHWQEHYGFAFACIWDNFDLYAYTTVQSINFRPLSTNAVQSLFGIYCQKGQHEHDNEIQCEPFLHKNIETYSAYHCFVTYGSQFTLPIWLW